MLNSVSTGVTNFAISLAKQNVWPDLHPNCLTLQCYSREILLKYIFWRSEHQQTTTKHAKVSSIHNSFQTMMSIKLKPTFSKQKDKRAAILWDFHQCGMCHQQRLRPACAYAQSDHSVCWSFEYSMIVKLLIELYLEFLSLKGGCTGWSESIHVKMPHCSKSHVTADKYF